MHSFCNTDRDICMIAITVSLSILCGRGPMKGKLIASRDHMPYPQLQSLIHCDRMRSRLVVIVHCWLGKHNRDRAMLAIALICRICMPKLNARSLRNNEDFTSNNLYNCCLLSYLSTGLSHSTPATTLLSSSLLLTKYIICNREIELIGK